MKTSLVTFPLQTGKKKRLITTYRNSQQGSSLRLKHEQDLLLLEQKYQINTELSFAYLKQQSIKKLVNKHLTNKYFYQFDIKNFFGSIDHQILLAMLANTNQELNEQLIYECSNNKQTGLSLGLVPSPFLSNIYMNNFDNQLIEKLQQLDKSIVYTRYSDDFTISAACELDLDVVITIIEQFLTPLKLKLNTEKTKVTTLSKKGEHIKVLGLNIICGNETNYITVGRKFKANAKHEKNPLVAAAMLSYIKYNED